MDDLPRATAEDLGDLWVASPDGCHPIPGEVPPRSRTELHLRADPVWMRRAHKAVGRDAAALMVALFLQTQSRMKKGAPFPVSNDKLMAWVGVDRYVRHRALAKLEAAGLISVKRAGRCAPVVTNRPVPRSDPNDGAL